MNVCGRFVASQDPRQLALHFRVQQFVGEALAPNYNVAPTDPVYAVVARRTAGSGEVEPVRQLRTVRWGLVPPWSKDTKDAARRINARAETVHEKPAFRGPFTRQRCLLPADGYYEWRVDDRGRKQPYFIRQHGGDALAFAGLYEMWRDRTRRHDDPAGWYWTCTIVTTAAEPGLAHLHERMPVVLAPDLHADWLDPHLTDPGRLRHLLHAPPHGRLMAYPVSRDVNSVRNNGPYLVEPLADDRRLLRQ